MPAIICSMCVTRLKVAYDFIHLAHASEKNLKAFLAKISNDFKIFTTGAEHPPSSVPESEIDVLLLADEASPATQQQKSHVEDDTMPKRKAEHDSNDDNVTKQQLNMTSTILKQTLIKNEVQTLSTPAVCKQEKQDNVPLGQGEVVGEFMVFEDDEANEAFNENAIQSDTINEISDDDDEVDDVHDTDDGESQVDLEMLDENLNQAEESNDLQAISVQHDKDGYLKEYEAMLEENENNFDDDDNENDIDQGNEEDLTEELHLQELEQEESEAVTTTQLYVMVEDTETSSSVAALMAVDKNDSSSSDQFKLAVPIARTGRTKPKFLSTAIEAVTALMTVDKNESGSSDQIKLEVPITRTGRTKPKTTTPRKMTSPASSKSNTAKPKKPALPSTDSRFYCMKCHRDFSTKTNLTRHMSIHEGNPKPYQCPNCGKRFTQNGSLKQHIYTHTGEKPYVCVVCDRGFTQCKSLVFHMRRHTGEKPFPCDQCGLSFRQKDGLKAHILKHHMISERELSNTCIICNEKFFEVTDLQLHMKKHINNHRDVSGGSSSVRQSNIILELMEDEELLSEQAFTNEELAADDDNIEDESTHVVDLLATSATEPRRAKKFQCRQCFKCFAIKKNLIRHLSVHTVPVSNLFPCKTCEIAFDTSLALNSHRLREHLESEIILNQCYECKIIFQNTAELNEHISLRHDLN